MIQLDNSSRGPRPVRAARFVMFATTVAAALVAIQCSHSSPTGPTAGSTVFSVTLTQTSLVAGGTSAGAVSLAAISSSAAIITMTSSNPSVATVQTPITIPAGSISAAFTFTAMGAGTAIITASLNNSSSQSPLLTVTHAEAISAISLSTSTVIGGGFVTATAILTGAAPAGGAAVALSATDPLSVPTVVVVPAGATSATFSIVTRAVDGTLTGTITGTYGGASATARVTVTPPLVATAVLGVSGPSETETCEMSNNGNTLNCRFTGSTSTAPGTITAWDWSYGVAATFAQTTTGPVLDSPAVDCSLMPPAPLPPGSQWLTMTVTLRIHDSLGNVSAVTTDDGVRLMPNHTCNY